ncbi:hypothetical protein D3C81_1718340 [compost metagenome]
MPIAEIGLQMGWANPAHAHHQIASDKRDRHQQGKYTRYRFAPTDHHHQPQQYHQRRPKFDGHSVRDNVITLHCPAQASNGISGRLQRMPLSGGRQYVGKTLQQYLLHIARRQGNP